MLANGITVRPVCPRKRFVDHGDGRGFFVVSLAKQAAPLERHAQQAKIFRRHLRNVDEKALPALGFLAFQNHQVWIQTISIVPQRKRCRITHGDFLHTGQRLAATDHFSYERRLLSGRPVNVRVRIVRHRQPRANRHHVLRVETRPHAQQIREAPQHQPRHNHQH